MNPDESIEELAGNPVPAESAILPDSAIAPSGRWSPPRLTLGLMMILIAVVAADFAAMAALTRGERRSAFLYGSTGMLVVLYDLLLYFTLLALQKVFRSGEGGRPSTGQIVATSLVLTIFVAIPVVVLIGMLMQS